MAKLSILEIVSVALFMSLILWHETSSSAITLDPSVVTEETTTTTKGRVSNECDGVFCPAGKCVVNGENRTATCVCPQRFCPLFIALVCGSDGKTYTNGCFLSSAACNSKTNITIEHNGRCNDSCTGFNCPYYGRCVVDPDSDRPKCVCPPGCPKNLNPVCGSDNETYDNECMLQSKACEKKINITVARYGRCDGSSCDGKTCPPGKHCERNSDGEPTCRPTCATMCTLQYDPVCGSDGRTYGNRCALDVEACKNKNITVAHTGECETDCAGIKCPNYGRCVFDDSQNRTMCVCRFGCPRIRRPVCGSDNQTYSNDCVLRQVACETNTSITVLHNGECVNGGLAPGLGCKTVLCPPGKFCVPNNNSEPECVCQKVCPDIYRPVCGSDNVTYPNDCELLRETCQTNKSITVIRHERCEGFRCDEITCPPGKSCDPSSGECHCNTACPDEEAPVCASNGKTYGNRCEFDVAVCLYDDNSMTVVHNGTCGTES